MNYYDKYRIKLYSVKIDDRKIVLKQETYERLKKAWMSGAKILDLGDYGAISSSYFKYILLDEDISKEATEKLNLIDMNKAHDEKYALKPGEGGPINIDYSKFAMDRPTTSP